VPPPLASAPSRARPLASALPAEAAKATGPRSGPSAPDLPGG
jgi:hypothetical protein